MLAAFLDGHARWITRNPAFQMAHDEEERKPMRSRRAAMNRRTCPVRLARTLPALLGLALLAPGAVAGPPPAPWVTKDIGPIDVPGSTDLDANGVWTLQGDGNDIFWYQDSFHFTYQPIRGDGSTSARFLSLQGGNGEWAKVGLMVRDNDTGGAANLNMPMTPGHGLHATFRQEQDGPSFSFNNGEVGPSRKPEPNLFMRLQRVDQEVTGFYSTDGNLWTQAFSAVTLPGLREEALFGLAVTSHRASALTTAKFDQVNAQPGVVSVYGLQACVSDRAVLLQWRRLRSAAGYNVYRGAVGTTPDQFKKLNSDQVAGTSFTDNSADLVNGTPVTYVVAPIVTGADGQPVEGPRVAVTATPAALPPGFFGCSIDEGARAGSATFDPATGEITLRHTGDQLFYDFDNAYFMGQMVEGDAQITVRLNSASTGPDPIASVMLRESLDPQSRQMLLGLVSCCLVQHWRLATGGPQNGGPVIERESVKLPVVLRLTRRGDKITAEYSKDEGKTFRPAIPAITFNPPLAKTLYIGVAANSGNRFTIGTAKFRDLVIQKL
jgi:hypothetical protein